MQQHKLLVKQIRKYLPEGLADDSRLQDFFNAVNDSYLSFERDKEISDHAFTVSEKEYKVLYENLRIEHEQKKRSIDKLKDALNSIGRESEKKFEIDTANLPRIAEELHDEILKRKTAEQNLMDNLQLLTTLVSNFHSAILIKDENKKILFTNRVFCDIFSLPDTPEQLQGRDYSKFPETIKDLFVNPDEFMETTEVIQKNKERVISDILYMADGRILQRYYIPINIYGRYRGHLWQYSDITEKKNFEKKLVDLTNIQNGILHGTDYSIIYTDIAGVIKSFNRGAENMLGYDAIEMIDLKTPECFHDYEEVMEKSRELSRELGREIKSSFDVFVEKSKSGAIDTNEWTYIKKNGERIKVLLSVSSIRDSENTIVGYLGIARNITQQKMAEEALILSEERYRTMVEHSSDIIYKTNFNGDFSYVNPVAEKIIGYSSEELLRMNYKTLIRKDYQEKTIEFYQSQVREKRHSTYFEFPIITKNGDEKWIGQSVQISSTNRKTFEFTALAIDITARIHYERNIRREKEKYENIITNMNLGLVEVDNNDAIKYANPGFSKITGYANDELIGKNATTLLARGNTRELIEGKLNLRRQGVSDMYEISVYTKSGEQRWWMISAAPNYDVNGNQTGSIGIHLDITDKKQLEISLEREKQRAEESSKAKEAFLANMSHEIRTPLNAIIGMLREIGAEDLTAKQKSYLKNTSVASQHLLSVLNNILDISKIEANEMVVDNHDFDLVNVLNEVKSIMHSRCEEKKLTLKINEVGSSENIFNGDSARLRQILLNIIGNAVKFTEKGGITVEHTSSPLKHNLLLLKIKIVDTGIGMSDDFVKNIYTKFSQEDSSVSRKYGGSGLGMAITKELVHLLNGSLKIDSAKNLGTTVTIEFLFKKGNVENIVNPLKQNFASLPEGIKVLLVEDNGFNRIVAKNALERQMCIVTECENGADALRTIESGEHFDVILMDLQMPVMDGFECTDRIRKNLKLKTPIIALTANAFKSELEQCRKIGMNDCVTKPFEEDQLISAIRNQVAPKMKSEGSPMEKTKEEIKRSEKLYSIEKLKALGNSNEEFLKKMIDIFCEQAALSVTQLTEAKNNNDLDKIYKVAHRIKPSIDSLDITTIKDVVKSIEKDGKEGNNSERLMQQIEFLCETLNTVVLQLRQERLQ